MLTELVDEDQIEEYNL